jgi:hypothetical protein
MMNPPLIPNAPEPFCAAIHVTEAPAQICPDNACRVLDEEYDELLGRHCLPLQAWHQRR